MIHSELKKTLLKKLGITPQALSLRAKAKKAKLTMSTEDAVYLIGHESGLNLSRYLPADTVDRVRELQVQLSSISRINVDQSKKSSLQKAKKEKLVLVRLPDSTTLTLPLLENHQIQDAKKMAAVYPILYILENSIRAFIIKSMVKYFGDNWWEMKVPPRLKDDVRNLIRREKTNAWHQKRSAREIDYLDFIDLKKLINKIDEKLLKDKILPRANWLHNIIDEVYEARCVLCHMNPLKDETIRLVNVNFTKWHNQIKEKYKELG